MILTRGRLLTMCKLCVILLVALTTVSCTKSNNDAKLTSGSTSPVDKNMLTIGSPAPALNVEHWVQNGDGKFKPVSKFEKGKVYVVEFWATWCGPCIASMPHIAELQQKYADKGVQIVSISAEDLETVNDFLTKKVRGAQDPAQTYGDLTKAYCLTADPDGSSEQDYMVASGQAGIPCAFVVGKDGMIDWIGHPMELDNVLDRVVEGKWDRQSYAETYIEERGLEKLLEEITEFVRKEDSRGAIKLVDNQLPRTKSEQVRTRLQLIKFQLQLMNPKEKLVTEQGVRELFSMLHGKSLQLNQVAWKIYENAADLDKTTVSIAEEAIEKELKQADRKLKAGMLDTLAHLQMAGGNLDKAIATQKEAIEIAAEDERATLTMNLQSMEAKKRGDNDSAK